MSTPRDTSEEAADRVRRIVMSRSAEERLRMWSRMSVGARGLAEAGVRMVLGSEASELDVRREVFLRFYGRELGRERALAIFEAIEANRAARSR